ncbi:MAG TPA: hypothetical protein VNC18_17230 [Gemmatimonadaceae bacterium]|jgi:hypothetical protein|nr:hypothetical protein [Gemmatimonadaceae bacterium]
MVLLSRMRVAARTIVLVALVGTADGTGRWTIVASNPRQLRALQVLDRRRPGVTPRIRFEWDAVPGARRYSLTGRWTSPPSWAIQSEQHRVTQQNATAWETHRVAFELPLPEGTHSWSVVALFGADEHGDFAHPTSASFDVR